MAYLLQPYRQENNLKCRLRNNLLMDDIHITITEGQGCVAEGKSKKKKEANAKKVLDLGGGMYCSNSREQFLSKVVLCTCACTHKL